MHTLSIKRYMRGLNSKELAEVAAGDGEYGKQAKAEIARRKRKREKKSA